MNIKPIYTTKQCQSILSGIGIRLDGNSWQKTVICKDGSVLPLIKEEAGFLENQLRRQPDWHSLYQHLNLEKLLS